ncbi:MAG: hypothetical protein RLO38_02575, partial [Roseovarius confluentis]
ILMAARRPRRKTAGHENLQRKVPGADRKIPGPVAEFRGVHFCDEAKGIARTPFAPPNQFNARPS